VRPMSDYHSVQPAMPCPEVGMMYGYDIIVYSAARGVVTLMEHVNGSKSTCTVYATLVYILSTNIK
jgi:hypothetical protein